MASPLSALGASSAKPAIVADTGPQNGLASDEARQRLEKFGPNAMPDTSMHPLRTALEKFWAPVPWMLEAAIVLELVLRQICRGRDNRHSAGVQRGAWSAPREPCPSDARCAEVPARIERICSARRRLENCARGRAGAG